MKLARGIGKTARGTGKIWMNMFLSYMLIILLCLGIFTAVVVVETGLSGRQQQEREVALQTQEVTNLIDMRLLSAQSVAANINSSITIKQLYLSVLNNEVLDGYVLDNIIKELQSMHGATRRLDIDAIVLFVKGYDRAYSSGGVIQLEEPFQNEMVSPAAVTVGNISEYFAVEAGGKLSFVSEGFLYVTDYTYTSTSNTGRGNIAVLFSLETLVNEVNALLEHDGGVRLLMGDTELAAWGGLEGNSVAVPSTVLDRLTVEVYTNAPALPPETVRTMWVMLLLAFVITVLFLALAFYFSKKYYKPIVDIKQLVGQTPPAGADEMEFIIDGIKQLIGERNGYRERMVTIAPYAQQGMLHGVLAGNVSNDTVKILSSTHYLDLQKPFFTISAANFTWQKEPADAGERITGACKRLCSFFSDEERSVHTMSRDSSTIFLVVNTEGDEPLDDLFFQIHRFIVESMADEGCLVTIGVDTVQDDINQLHDACSRALQALDEMLLAGRDEVYFYDEGWGPAGHDYYFPKNSEMRLGKLVKERNLEGVRLFLDDMYQKNLSRPNISAAALRALVDELHITTLRCVKQSSELNTTHIRVEKMNTISTLEEIFNYYYAVFETLIQQLATPAQAEAESSDLSGAILKYVDENFTLPEISLQMLTDKFGVSSKYISLLYKNQLGTTYLQSLHTKRINHAMQLLVDTNDTLEQVGEKCGYTNPLTFRRNFKMQTGLTPSEYRQQKQTARQDGA